MTPEQRETLKRENPGAWVVLCLAGEFPDRNIKRDVRIIELVNEASDAASAAERLAALDETVKLARNGVDSLRKRSAEYEREGDSAMELILYARADERCEIADAIEALKSASPASPEPKA